MLLWSYNKSIRQLGDSNTKERTMKCEICDKQAPELKPTSYSGSMACQECREVLASTQKTFNRLVRQGLNDLRKGKMYRKH